MMPRRIALNGRSARRRPRRIPRSVPRPAAPPAALQAPAMKYFDYYYSSVATTTPTTFKMTNIPQAVTQSARVADTIVIRRMDITMVLEASSNDVTNQMRWAMFNWIPDDTAVAPGTAAYFESPAVFGPLSPLNYEGRANFRTIVDRFVTIAGTGSAPTALSIRTFRTSIRKHFRIDFQSTTLYGTNHVYYTIFSNSALSPHPSYFLTVRFWYSDTF